MTTPDRREGEFFHPSDPDLRPVAGCATSEADLSEHALRGVRQRSGRVVGIAYGAGFVSDIGDAEVGFEELYAKAGEKLAAVPWASLAPHPALVAWLDRQPPPRGETALVIGCGYGDDAEELGRRGYRVTAFDIAPTAIARCRERFPSSDVEYRVADLFALPQEWQAGFGLVVEIRTLQSLPPERRAAAARAVAETVRPGGKLWLRCLGRDDDEPVADRPWPVSRRELSGLGRAGLHELEFLEQPLAAGRGRTFTVVYGRR